MQPLIAVRIKDGLFVGNATAAQDDEFLFLNKVQHVVNCCSTEVSNLYAQANIQYLAFPWKDIPSTVMFDSHDRNVDQIFKFIERGLADGECVLVHSYFGLSRCCAIVAAYLMTKYGWTADSALTFMAVAHPDMAIKPHFLRQLRAFGKRQPLEPDIFYPYVDTTELALDNEQWAIRNTYLNALTSDIFQRHDIITVMKRHNLCPEFRSSVPVGSAADYHGRRISFVDTKQGTTVASNVTVPVQHNPVRAGPGRLARPILVNTDYTPQRHLLLSPVSIDPKGRQAFRVIDSEKEDTKQSSSHMHHQQAHFYNHSAEFPDYNSQNTYRNFTNSGHSPASANHPSLTQRPKLNNTVHSPFILKAANSARKGSPMPETRRLLRTRQPENAPERSTNSPRSQREQQSTGLSRPIPSRTNSPITVRQQATGTPPPNRNSPSHARDMNPPVPRKLTYNSVNLRQPQRTGSPTQRKTTTNQIADSPVGQYTLGMGLRSLYDREPNLSASSNTYGSRPASATNMNGIQQKQLVSSHSARAGTPTDRFHTYGPSPTSLGNRSAMSSRKLARP